MRPTLRSSRGVHGGDATGGTREPRPSTLGPGRLVRAVRLGLIAVVLCGELTFLLWVYQLDDGVAEQRAALAAVAALASADDDLTAPPAAGAAWREAVATLVATDAPGAREVQAALASGSSARMREAVSSSDTGVGQAEAHVDRLAVGLLALLFVLVCVGWFAWFGRLARRHRAAQRALTAREVAAVGERRIRALVEHSSDLVVVLDQTCTMTFVSSAARSVLGRDASELGGRRFLDLVIDEDRPVLAHLLGCPARGEQALELRVSRADARVRAMEGTLKDLSHDDAVRGWVLTLRDVTERRALEESLTHQAFHDELTGLANRKLFADRLTHALARREATRAPLSVLSVDLDDFKSVNDSLGHRAGDELLVAVARRAEQVLRPEDTAARLGADEFAILLEDTAPATAAVVGQRLLDAFAAPFTVAEHRQVVRVSIGLVGLERDATADGDLMRNADLAMHVAKERGTSCLATYDATLHTRALELLELRADLADGIERDELVLHFQPTVHLHSEQVSGFEALVRWQHPTRGLLFPGDFIPEAERSGLVVPLGEWVLRAACRAGASLQAGGRGPSMAVNVAAAQLSQAGFGDLVLDTLAESGLPADRLVLEITETAMVEDVDDSFATLSRLRERGVRVAIDDFGTGYNSLASLRRLPADVLKVDKSFVDRIGGPDHDSSLVEAILAMSDALGLTAVAEGVELPDQARWLRQHSAAVGQGYLWSRPVPLDGARDLLRSGVPRVADRPASSGTG